MKGVHLSDESLMRGMFVQYYISSVLAILCSSIGQIVGNMVIGNRISAEKLGVISLALPVYYVFATVGNLMGIGGSAVCGRYMGKRDAAACRKAYTVTALLCLGVSAVCTVVLLALLPLLPGWLGAPASLTADLTGYLAVMIAGGVFTAGIYISFNCLRMDGQTVSTTLVFVCMAAVTVVSDFLLIPWGLTGISLANVAGAAAATVFGLLRLRKSDNLRFCRVGFKEFRYYAGQILRVGSPGASENASILLKSYAFNGLIVGLLTASALGRLSIINSINSFSMAITVGCAGALVPFVSVFSAERDTVSIRRMVKAALSVGAVLVAVFGGALALFAPEVAGWFGVTGSADETVTALRLFALSLPVSLLSNSLIYLHLANAHTGFANLLTVLRCLVFAVLSAFCLVKSMGERGLWLSFTVCEVAVLAVAAVWQGIYSRLHRDVSPVLLLDTRCETAGTSIALCVADTDEAIAGAVEQLGAFCEQNELSPKQTMLVTMSMDEMMHMAAAHSTAYSKQHRISLRVLVSSDMLVLRLRYDGAMFNPLAYYEEKRSDTMDLDAMLALADCLGIKMVTDTCKTVDYRTTFGVNNLTVVL